eukprot:scaffold2251_cov178-Amphora_coffeaeformis.AAC.1
MFLVPHIFDHDSGDGSQYLVQPQTTYRWVCRITTQKWTQKYLDLWRKADNGNGSTCVAL